MLKTVAMYVLSWRTGVRVVVNLRLHGVGSAVRNPHVDRKHIQLSVDFLLHFIVRFILLGKKTTYMYLEINRLFYSLEYRFTEGRE